MYKHKKYCVKCGGQHVRKRRATKTKQVMSESALLNIQVAGYLFCLTMICIAVACVLIGDEVEEMFTSGFLRIGGIAVVLLVGGWYFRVFPFTRKRIHHYKCSKCGYTWDG